MTYGATAVAKTNQSLMAPGVMNGINQVWRSLSPSGGNTDSDHPEDTWVYAGLNHSIKRDINRLFESGIPKKTTEDTEETGRRWEIAWRQTLMPALVAVVIFVGGTSLAFARPESALAAPFRGVAGMLAQATVAAADIIDEASGVAAGYERQTMSSALQAMRVVNGISTLTPVTTPTNDMAAFPSAENPLYPDYLDRRYSQFNYTIDGYGNVVVDNSVATTDAFLEQVKVWLADLSVED